jgi:hypothetical protein
VPEAAPVLAVGRSRSKWGHSVDARRRLLIRRSSVRVTQGPPECTRVSGLAVANPSSFLAQLVPVWCQFFARCDGPGSLQPKESLDIPPEASEGVDFDIAMLVVPSVSQLARASCFGGATHVVCAPHFEPLQLQAWRTSSRWVGVGLSDLASRGACCASNQLQVTPTEMLCRFAEFLRFACLSVDGRASMLASLKHLVRHDQFVGHRRCGKLKRCVTRGRRSLDVLSAQWTC